MTSPHAGQPSRILNPVAKAKLSQGYQNNVKSKETIETDQRSKEGRDFGRVPYDSLYLNEDVLWKACDLDSRTSWLVVAKELGINAVDGREIVHVLQEDLLCGCEHVSRGGRGRYRGELL